MTTEEQEDAIRSVLISLGHDLTSESMRETPRRIIATWREFSQPQSFEFTTFPAEGANQMVIQAEIPVMSICEHHALNFFGRAVVGYIPNERIVGLSKLARTVDFFARRFQTQERITQQVLDFLVLNLNPKGVGVIISAQHCCMVTRGIKAIGSETITNSLWGAFKDDPATRAEFMAHSVKA